MAKITTKITSFTDVQKSLQEIEKVLNELTQSVNFSFGKFYFSSNFINL